MKLLVIGVNHKTAPISLREKLAFADDEIQEALKQLSQYTDGSVIVSTCNRTEIYALVAPISANFDGFEKRSNDIKRWLATNKRIPLGHLEEYIYTHEATKAINHWIRVASGLDSMVLGEPQILGQIKKSVMTALHYGGVSNKLNWIIDQVFGAAKQVRHDTQVGSQAVTLGFATAKLTTQIFEDITNCCLLLVAAGEMNRLVAKHLTSLGVGRIIICNRTLEKAQKLAHELKDINPQCNISVEPLSVLDDCLNVADIVCSSSGSMHPLIKFSSMKKVIKKRRYRPILMVDLAVPRDIEEKVAKLDEVYLYSIDDLQSVIAGNLEQRKQAAVDAELLISQLVVDIDKRHRVRAVGSDIKDFRQVASDRVDNILQEFIQQLPESADDSIEELMTELTRRLTQTLTHSPSKLMRKVASEGDDEALDIVVSTLTDAYRK